MVGPIDDKDRAVLLVPTVECASAAQSLNFVAGLEEDGSPFSGFSVKVGRN